MSRTGADVELVMTAGQALPQELTDRVVVVIDVFRATTSMDVMLRGGAALVRTTASVEEARRLAQEGDWVLAGERGGVAPEGFDYGNSPAELSAADLRGKPVLLTTTNGTQAVAAAASASRVVTACLRNSRACAAAAGAQGAPVTLLCAGTAGRFSIEDFACAGHVAAGLARMGYRLTDAAAASQALAGADIARVITAETCRHYRTLLEKGFADDITCCLQLDVSDVVPLLDAEAGGFVIQ